MHSHSNTGRTLRRHDKEIVESRKQDPRVGRKTHGNVVSIPCDVVERNTTLVAVDRVRDAAHADERGGRKVGCGELQCASDLDRALGEVGNGRASGVGAVVVEQVGRLEVLAVGVVDRLVAASGRALDFVDVAEASAADEDARVGKENGDGVVVARHCVSGELGPLLRLGVEEFGDEDTVGVGEHERLALSAGDEHSAVWQHDSVGEAAGEGEVSDTLNRGWLVGFSNGRDVGFGGRGAFSVVLSSSSAEDLTSDRIVHDPDTTHGVLGVASSGFGDGSTTSSTEPVLILTGACLEDTALLPPEEPCVVVLTPDTLVVLCENWVRVCVWEIGPFLGIGVVYLAVLGLSRTGVGTADCENSTVRQDC